MPMVPWPEHERTKYKVFEDFTVSVEPPWKPPLLEMDGPAHAPIRFEVGPHESPASEKSTRTTNLVLFDLSRLVGVLFSLSLSLCVSANGISHYRPHRR